MRVRGRKRNAVIVMKSLSERDLLHTIDNISIAAIHRPKLRQGNKCCGVLG
jgi:hypothetical protein